MNDYSYSTTQYKLDRSLSSPFYSKFVDSTYSGRSYNLESLLTGKSVNYFPYRQQEVKYHAIN